MPTLRFPTGTRSGVNSTPGRSTGRGSGYMTAQVEKASMQKLARQLESVEPKLRDEIAKKALREWGKAVRKAARANAWKNAERTKQQMTYKVKRYKRAVWAGVGVKTDKIDRKKKVTSAGRKSPYVGWKAHFMEVGWHAWPKGVRGNVERGVEMLRNRRIAAGEGATRQITVYRNGKPHVRTITERARTLSRDGTGPGGGRGWRKGVRGRLGRFLTKYARHYMWRAAQVGRQLATNKVVPSINDALRSAARTA